uniref:Uncharacterized protein n=1 Tax=Sphingomonas sp. JE1 TaxID=1628059 RepID=A0A0D5A055_9SPHN|nr:hypothetical protein pJE1_233 [Sphingomonas sp. JE1]
MVGDGAPLVARGLGGLQRKGVAMKAETTLRPLLPAWAKASRVNCAP